MQRRHILRRLGDPFASTADLSGEIAKGHIKLVGTETINGIATQVFAGASQGANMKAWIDMKDNLVIRAELSAAGTAPMTMVNITKVSFATPPASLFVLPASCASVKPPPTAAELIADETGDDAANYVNGIYGPGSTNSCSVVLRVVNAKTMTPITHIQVAIDTTYNQDNPPHYESGVHDDGTETFSGGGIREITSMVHNGTVSLGTPPTYFMLEVESHPARTRGRHGTGLSPVLLAHHSAARSGEGLRPAVRERRLLWVKSGKYAVPPSQ